MTAANVSEQSTHLRVRVNVVEGRLIQRRQRVGKEMVGIGTKIRARMISPGMLLTASCVGVVVEQSGRRRGWSLAAVLNAVNSGSAMLMTLLSWMKAVPQSSIAQSSIDIEREDQ